MLVLLLLLISRLINRSRLRISQSKVYSSEHKKPNPQQQHDYEEQWDKEKECPELKTLECDILNPDLLINLEIKFMRTTSNI